VVVLALRGGIEAMPTAGKEEGLSDLGAETRHGLHGERGAVEDVPPKWSEVLETTSNPPDCKRRGVAKRGKERSLGWGH
jgi:hypothetical protein